MTGDNMDDWICAKELKSGADQSVSQENEG
jgi:hypothetical protein